MIITAISFDVWNTLLRIDIVYSGLAKTISAIKGFDFVEVERKIYEVYKKAREIRLYIDSADEVRNFIVRSRNLLAKTLGIDYDDVVKAIDETFSSIDKSSLLYNDVSMTLDLIESHGISMGIIGNTVFWESIYNRELLEYLGLKRYFKVQLYSDEVGVFKPNRRIFLEFCRRLNVKPSEVIHVGDNVIEDIGGALSAGMKAMLIDRSGKKILVQSLGVMVSPRLEDIVEAIQMLG